MKKVPRDKKGFRRWLKTKNQYSAVGYPRELCQCPLSNYYSSLTGEAVAVGDTVRFESQDIFEGRSPTKWELKFMEHVDDLTGSILAIEALAILQSI